MSRVTKRTALIAGAVVLTFAMVSNLIGFGLIEGFEMFEHGGRHYR